MSKFYFKLFLLFKMPIAFIAGLNLIYMNDEKSRIKVKLKFLNQNPFNSMFWAVQGMAAEISTGILCINYIKQSKKKVSMLITNQKGDFYKKAKGTVIFKCNQGLDIKETINKAIHTKESQTITLKSQGFDQQNNIVSEFTFKWTFLVKD